MDFTWSFTDEFTDNAKILYDLLFTKEFNAEELIKQLKTGMFSAQDINLAAYKYVEDCTLAELDACDDKLFDNLRFGETLPGIESSHLTEAIQILLEYGLDPNKIIHDNVEKTNIMLDMMFVNNGYQAADAAVAMLEHGGNPNLLIEGVSLIHRMNFDMLLNVRGEQEFRYFADSVIHYWMVFIGYGANYEDGGESIDPVGSFDISNLRNHLQYYYGMIHSDRSNDGMEVCFFDKDTNWEVARF